MGFRQRAGTPLLVLRPDQVASPLSIADFRPLYRAASWAERWPDDELHPCRSVDVDP